MMRSRCSLTSKYLPSERAPSTRIRSSSSRTNSQPHLFLSASCSSVTWCGFSSDATSEKFAAYSLRALLGRNSSRCLPRAILTKWPEAGREAALANLKFCRNEPSKSCCTSGFKASKRTHLWGEVSTTAVVSQNTLCAAVAKSTRAATKPQRKMRIAHRARRRRVTLLTLDISGPFAVYRSQPT